MAPFLQGLVLGGEPAPWHAAGFRVKGGGLQLGPVKLRFAGPEAGAGIAGWSLSGLLSTELDGLPTTAVEPAIGAGHGSSGPASPAGGPAHPNRAVSLDHVVVMTPDFDRTAAALQAAGLELRRTRDAGTEENPVKQGFYRLGEVILEVVAGKTPLPGLSSPADASGPAAFWGLVVVVEDLEASAEHFGEHLGTPRDAVQPGRRIATVRKEAGLGLPVALMTPHVRRRAEAQPRHD